MLLPFLLCILILYIPPPAAEPLRAWQFSAAGVCLLALVNAAFCWAGSGLAVRLYRQAGERGAMAADRVFVFLKGLTVGLVLADVMALQWPRLVAGWFRGQPWQGLAFDLVLLLPALVMVLTIMGFQYRFEARRGRISLPLVRYMWLRFRVEIAIVLAPWVMLVLATGLTAMVFRHSRWYATADLVASGVVLVGVLIFSPLLLRGIWRTSPLPDGPLRDRLEEFCRRTGFRCNDILIWHTHRHLANAGVVGPTPLLRYVMLTDSLLHNCAAEEVEAIFAHEVGHVRHRHLPFYLLMGAAFVAFYANVMDAAAALGFTEPLDSILALGLTTGQACTVLAFAAFYWAVCFGYISRRMERQADFYALEAVEDPWAFVNAMGKLAQMSGRPRAAGSWRHFSIERRIDYLREAIADPTVARRAGRRVRAIKVGVMVLFALAAARILIARPELLGL